MELAIAAIGAFLMTLDLLNIDQKIERFFEQEGSTKDVGIAVFGLILLIGLLVYVIGGMGVFIYEIFCPFFYQVCSEVDFERDIERSPYVLLPQLLLWLAVPLAFIHFLVKKYFGVGVFRFVAIALTYGGLLAAYNVAATIN